MCRYWSYIGRWWACTAWPQRSVSSCCKSVPLQGLRMPRCMTSASGAHDKIQDKCMTKYVCMTNCVHDKICVHDKMWAWQNVSMTKYVWMTKYVCMTKCEHDKICVHDKIHDKIHDKVSQFFWCKLLRFGRGGRQWVSFPLPNAAFEPHNEQVKLGMERPLAWLVSLRFPTIANQIYRKPKGPPPKRVANQTDWWPKNPPPPLPSHKSIQSNWT